MGAAPSTNKDASLHTHRLNNVLRFGAGARVLVDLDNLSFNTSGSPDYVCLLRRLRHFDARQLVLYCNMAPR